MINWILFKVLNNNTKCTPIMCSLGSYIQPCILQSYVDLILHTDLSYIQPLFLQIMCHHVWPYFQVQSLSCSKLCHNSGVRSGICHWRRVFDLWKLVLDLHSNIFPVRFDISGWGDSSSIWRKSKYQEETEQGVVVFLGWHSLPSCRITWSFGYMWLCCLVWST